MYAHAMNQDTAKGRAIAMAARINAAIQDAAAVRACVGDLEQRVRAADLRAARLVARLARIERYAQAHLARARDEQARLALGDIAVTAAERDAPSAVA
jgi:hypothetical protein